MMAAIKNKTRPIAAAIPMSGTRMPTSNPTAPAALGMPSVVSYDSDTPTLAMLMRICL
jgi:hypothetical protein